MLMKAKYSQAVNDSSADYLQHRAMKVKNSERKQRNTNSFRVLYHVCCTLRKSLWQRRLLSPIEFCLTELDFSTLESR